MVGGCPVNTVGPVGSGCSLAQPSLLLSKWSCSWGGLHGLQVTGISPGQWRTLVSSLTRPLLTSEPHCPETNPLLALLGVSLQHRGCPGSKVFVFLWGKGPCPPTLAPTPAPGAAEGCP